MNCAVRVRIFSYALPSSRFGLLHTRQFVHGSLPLSNSFVEPGKELKLPVDRCSDSLPAIGTDWHTTKRKESPESKSATLMGEGKTADEQPPDCTLRN